MASGRLFRLPSACDLPLEVRSEGVHSRNMRRNILVRLGLVWNSVLVVLVVVSVLLVFTGCADDTGGGGGGGGGGDNS